MTRMIRHPSQIFDECRHPWQGPEVGLVAVCAGAHQQRLDDPLRLLHRQLGFPTCRALAGQSGTPALLPGVLPAVSNLPGHSQTPGHFWGRVFLVEQFARLLAALFHLAVVSCLRHATIIHGNPTHVTLLCESQ